MTDFGSFDPAKSVKNAALILDANGEWPNFHDASVLNLNIWRGDLRPDDGVYTFPVIDLAFWLCALERPFRVDLRFTDCEAIRIENFNDNNDIVDLGFRYLDRGFYADGKTPMIPSIEVTITPGFGLAMQFTCFGIEVVGRSAAYERKGIADVSIPLTVIGSPRDP